MKMTANDLAKKYNTTAAKIQQAACDWQCAEGYDQDGREYETLGAWLDMLFLHAPKKQTLEPYQKGDEYCY